MPQQQQTLWFETWHQAVHFSHEWNLDQKPELRDVWLDYAWRQKWSLRVPMDWEISLTNN